MIELTTIMEQLTGQALTNSLIEFLDQHCEGFPEIREKFQEAIVQTERETDWQTQSLHRQHPILRTGFLTPAAMITSMTMVKKRPATYSTFRYLQ